MEKVSENEPLRRRSVLLITSHPDDESMFFLPTLRYFQQLRGSKIYLLCLSTGNANGLGPIRKKELEEACKFLGISGQYGGLDIIDDSRLPDGLRTEWPEHVVSEHVLSATKRISPDIIVTFDEGGVSHHSNHISTSRGVQQAWRQLRKYMGSHVTVPTLLLLETTSLFRKYLGPLDIILSSIMGNNKNLHVLRTGQNGPRLAWNALQRHESQFVWYRKLFIVTSRYVYTNTLIEVVL